MQVKSASVQIILIVFALYGAYAACDKLFGTGADSGTTSHRVVSYDQGSKIITLKLPLNMTGNYSILKQSTTILRLSCRCPSGSASADSCHTAIHEITEDSAGNLVVSTLVDTVVLWTADLNYNPIMSYTKEVMKSE